jgi:small subunit ribosomal protein S18
MPRLVKPYKKREGTGRPSSGRPGGGRYMRKKRPCPFCVEKGKVISYRDVAGLRRFMSEQGKIEPRRRTSACARHQRAIAAAIKKGRSLALLPYTGTHLRVFGTAEFAPAPERPAPPALPQTQPQQASS